jgi:hypothetical protein
MISNCSPSAPALNRLTSPASANSAIRQIPGADLGRGNPPDCIHLKVTRQTSTKAICAIKIFWKKPSNASGLTNWNWSGPIPRRQRQLLRTFGWLHPAAKIRRNRVRALLGELPLLTVDAGILSSDEIADWFGHWREPSAGFPRSIPGAFQSVMKSKPGSKVLGRSGSKNFPQRHF